MVGEAETGRILRLLGTHGSGDYRASDQLARKETGGLDVVEPGVRRVEGRPDGVGAVSTLLLLTNAA